MGKANQLRIAKRNLAAQGIPQSAQQAELARLNGLSSAQIRAGNQAARPALPQTATVNALPKPPMPNDLEQFPHVTNPVISDPVPPWMQARPQPMPMPQSPSPMAGALMGGAPSPAPQFTPQLQASMNAFNAAHPDTPPQQQAQVAPNIFGGAKPPMSQMQRPAIKPPGSI